jgi:hypothetical protein
MTNFLLGDRSSGQATPWLQPPSKDWKEVTSLDAWQKTRPSDHMASVGCMWRWGWGTGQALCDISNHHWGIRTNQHEMRTCTQSAAHLEHGTSLPRCPRRQAMLMRSVV